MSSDAKLGTVDVIALCGLHNVSHLWFLVKKGRFPKPEEDSDGIKFWTQQVVDAWLKAKQSRDAS